MSTLRLWTLACALGASSWMAATNAFADPPAAPTPAQMIYRQTLLDQIPPAVAAGDHTRALDAARRAGAILMTPSLRMSIAQEQNALNQTAPAYASAYLCVREAERDTALANRDAILSRCRTVLEANRTRIGNLTLKFDGTVPKDIVIDVGGESYSPDYFGTPFPVTPGNVVVNANAPGMRPFHTQATVAQGATIELSIKLEADPTAGGTTVRQGGTVSVGAIVVMVLGAGVMGSSGAFFAMRNEQIAALKSHCDVGGSGPVICDNDQVTKDLIGSAQTYNGLVNGALALGGAMVLAGGIWLAVGLATPSRAATTSTRASAWTVVPTVSVAPSGASFGAIVSF